MQPLRFATAGSVDDGKSTLIGRLLYDARAIQEDQLAAVERASLRRGAAELDLSLLTDGLEAEREQGITIDVAYRYFATPQRKFIIADSPGHEQYTRNMATGASNADALLLLADVTKGLLEQTKKHLHIARLLGIRQAVLFVNKMDLVGYARSSFEAVLSKVEAFAAPLGFDTLAAIPGSALLGDMVVERGEALPWYTGPTLLERLETLEASSDRAAAGQILVLPGGRRTRIRQILSHGTEREIAVAGDSVTLVLADDVDLARGDLIADPANPPREARSLGVTLVWLGDEPLRPGGRYLVQQASRRTLATVEPDGVVRLNDIARARLSLHAPLFVDAYEEVRVTGCFILIDEATNHTVAAGLVQ